MHVLHDHANVRNQQQVLRSAYTAVNVLHFYVFFFYVFSNVILRQLKAIFTFPVYRMNMIREDYHRFTSQIYFIQIEPAAGNSDASSIVSIQC